MPLVLHQTVGSDSTAVLDVHSVLLRDTDSRPMGPMGLSQEMVVQISIYEDDGASILLSPDEALLVAAKLVHSAEAARDRSPIAVRESRQFLARMTGRFHFGLQALIKAEGRVNR